MRRNRAPMHALLGPLALVLSVVLIVAGTLQWPVGVCYAIFIVMLTVALVAARTDRVHRRGR